MESGLCRRFRLRGHMRRPAHGFDQKQNADKQEPHSVSFNFFDKLGYKLIRSTCLRSILAEKGITGPWTGLGAGLLRQCSYTTVRLGVYRKLEERYTPKTFGEKLGLGKYLYFGAKLKLHSKVPQPVSSAHFLATRPKFALFE